MTPQLALTAVVSTLSMWSADSRASTRLEAATTGSADEAEPRGCQHVPDARKDGTVTVGRRRPGEHLERQYETRYILTDPLWSYLQEYRRRHEAAGNGFGYSKVGPGDVSRTLSARYYKDGSEILIDRGPNRSPRRLTPTECGRLMGFPRPTRGARPTTVSPSDHPTRFYIPVSDVHAYRQFGNAVVPSVIENLAAHLARDANLPALRDRMRSRPSGS